MVSGVKVGELNLVDTFLGKQVDICARLEHFLINKSWDLKYVGIIKFYSGGLFSFTYGINNLHSKFPPKHGLEEPEKESDHLFNGYLG